MPNDEIAAEKAATIETELQASIEEAKADVADEAATKEEKRLAEERLVNLERRLNEVEARSYTPSTVTPEVPAPVAAPVDAVSALADKVAAIAAPVTEPVADVAEAVTAPVVDAVEDATEVVESLPKRTHSLFKPLFGRHD